MIKKENEKDKERVERYRIALSNAMEKPEILERMKKYSFGEKKIGVGQDKLRTVFSAMAVCDKERADNVIKLRV